MASAVGVLGLDFAWDTCSKQTGVAMLILVDQDGVLANFEQAFYQAWQQSRHQQNFPAIPPEQRRHFYPRDDYPAEYAAFTRELIASKGFFRQLPPMAGAVDALKAMQEAGHEVVICTAPINEYQYCVPEKYEWVEAHLGLEWTRRMVVTKDKTLVHGDVLIDDRPHIHGHMQPQWQHVLYDQPYNRDVDKPRLTWGTWQQVLQSVAW